MVMSSETGVLDIAPENVAQHGRLEPGKMFLVNMEEGRIVDDEAAKTKIVKDQPYAQWLEDNLLPLKNISYTGNPTPEEAESFETRLRVFGYPRGF